MSTGVVADTFSRRKIMLVTDITRMFIVLGFLLVRSEEFLWLLFFLVRNSPEVTEYRRRSFSSCEFIYNDVDSTSAESLLSLHRPWTR